MKPCVLGYIVVTRFGATLSLGNYHDGPRSGLLLSDGVMSATLFESRRGAVAALKRTQKYARRHRLKWDLEHP